jgi:hypothetical protein
VGASRDIPVEFLRECFGYDPRTGVLTWRDRPRSHFKTNGARGEKGEARGQNLIVRSQAGGGARERNSVVG